MKTTVRVPETLAHHSAKGSLVLKAATGRLSPHFRAEELACPCGECDRIVVHWALVELLQRMRWRIGRPLTITSGFRCPSHNEEIGGATASLHVFGMAADVQCSGLSPKQLADVADNCGAGGLGLYDRHLHVDVGKPRQWEGEYN